MADENTLWGAERIRGELAKLGLRVAKRTIQAYLRDSRAPRPRGQPWATFLCNHADGIWACDFLPVTDALFQPLFAFFVVELSTRRVVHVGATRHPTDAWVAQQLREATPFDQRPKYLVRDNDGKFGTTFARVAGTSGIEIVHTPYRVPRANAVCERFLGSVRRECVAPVLAEKSIRPASPAPDGAGVVALSGGCRAIVDGTVAGWTSRPAQVPRTPQGPVGRRDVLGGLLHHYYRDFA